MIAGNFETFLKICNNPEYKFDPNERVLGSDDRYYAPLLHLCASDLTVLGQTSREVVSGKCKVARHLLSLRDPSLDIAAEDNDTRNILHWAALLNDAALINVVLGDREHNSARKASLDINGICHKQGWTPLHYAAEKGNLAACKALLQGGASLSVNAAIINSKDGSIKSKGPTALELVKQRMKKPGSPQHLSALEAVCSELTRLTNEETKAKEQKEQSKQRKEQESAIEREKISQKESESANEQEKQPPKESTDLEKSAKAESSKDAEKNEKKKKKKKKAASETTNQERQLDPLSSLVVATDLISRDEMLENLMNMGFPEADCMAAIVACGTNIDRAISWLCERPTPSTQNSNPTNAPPAKPASAASQTPKPAAVVTKEKDHKEELRRINKAWNQKAAEDELRRQEQERKAKEAAKQQAALPPKPSVISLKDLEKQQSFHSPSRNGQGSKVNGNSRLIPSPGSKPILPHQVRTTLHTS